MRGLKRGNPITATLSPFLGAYPPAGLNSKSCSELLSDRSSSCRTAMSRGPLKRYTRLAEVHVSCMPTSAVVL